MKYMHIMKNDKFETKYIEFIEKNFEISEHLFFFIDGKLPKKVFKKNIKILTYKNKKDFLLFQAKYINAKKVYVHGLSNAYLALFCFFNFFNLKKINWIIWGGDLHFYEQPKSTMKEKSFEWIRKKIIPKFGGYITQVEEEYELCKKWYGVGGPYYNCFVYPSNLYKELNILSKKDNKIYIQIGNSANTRNNHIEILDKLEMYKGENIEIICPLSYGNKVNGEEVKKYGERLFGEKFKPLMEFLEYNEYLKIMSKIDIAIFNHKRQQAMGNIMQLIGMGKKVYLNSSDFVTSKLINDLDIKVWDSMKEFSLEKISLEEAEQNNKKIKERFSEEKLKEELENVFYN